MFKGIYGIYIPVFVLLNSISFGTSQSPCPDYFRYLRDDVTGDILGEIEIPSPPKNVALHLRISLSVASSLPTKYFGRLDLANSKSDAVKAVEQGQSLIYRLQFPIRNPVPLLTEIMFNGQRYCVGSRAMGPIVTTIFLDHTLYPPGVMEPPDNGPSSNPNEYSKIPQMSSGTDFSPKPVSRPSGNPYRPVLLPKEYDQTSIEVVELDVEPSSSTNKFLNTRPISPGVNFSPKPVSRPSDHSYRPILSPNEHDQIFIDKGKPDAPSSNTNQFLNAPPNNHDHRTLLDRGQAEILPSTTMVSPPSGFLIPESVNNDEKNCGRPYSTGVNFLIANGKKTAPGQWPWLAVIFLAKLELKFQCGGNLITDRHVITAAHCKFDNGIDAPASTFLVSLGRYNLDEWRERGSKSFEVLEFRGHPEYRSRLSADADIAVIILREKVQFTSRIQPVCLWTQPVNLESLVGLTGFVVGWGKDEKGNQYLKEPRMAIAPIVSQEICLRSHISFGPATSNRTLCAGGKDGSGPCNGDSGGGLVTFDSNTGRYHLRGIVSLSLLDLKTLSCDLSQYVVYVDIAKFLGWIKVQTEY